MTFLDDIDADLARAEGAARSSGGRKLKDGRGRLRKLACPDGCGTIVQGTFGNLEANGWPRCSCGAELILANFRDRWAFDYDNARAELADAVGATRRQLRAELLKVGYTAADLDAAVGDVTERQSSDGSMGLRCREATTYCTRLARAGSQFCAEHDPAERERAARAIDRRVQR